MSFFEIAGRRPLSGSLTVHALRLKNSRGQVLAEIELPQGGQTLTTGQTYYFDSELYKVTFEQEALEGSSFEAFSAYYNKGNKISFGIDVKEGYNAEGLQVQTDGGEKLEKNAEGLFELTVGKDTVISYSGIAKDQPVEPTPSVTPEPTVPSSGEEEKDSDKDYTVVIVAVIAVVVIAVIALACVIVFVLKKKKK